MWAMPQLGVKEGQQRGRPHTALSAKGNSSQLVSDTLGHSIKMQTSQITNTANANYSF